MLNIPLPMRPGQQLEAGFNSINDIINRTRTEALKRKQMQDAAKQWEQQFGLQKEAAGRAAALQPLQKMLLMQKIQQAQRANDPNAFANDIESVMNHFGGGHGGQQQGGGQQPNMPMPGQPQQQPAVGMGQGMFAAPGQPVEQQQAPMQQQQPQKQDPFARITQDPRLVNNPVLQNIVGGMFKKELGVNPFEKAAQTPEEKKAAELDLFKQKEQIKQANKIGSGETLTAPIKTKYQNVIGGVTSARPILQKLIAETKKGNIPGQMIGLLFKRDAQANYKGEISTLLDGVRNAYTIPNTDSGTAKAEDKVLRKPGESDANYAKRLESILAQMNFREKDARVKLNAGNITASNSASGDDYSQMSDEELHRIAGGG